MYKNHNEQIIVVKKTRKKTIISMEERCKAIINDGKQCSRRKKYHNFCGKHKLKQPFGVVSTININNFNFMSECNPNLIEVKKFKYKQIEYLIDKNNIIFNKEGTKIIGKLDNEIIFL